MTQDKSLQKSWFISQNLFEHTPSQQAQASQTDRIYFLKSKQIQTKEYMIQIPWYNYQKEQQVFQWRFYSEFPISKIYHARILEEQRDLARVSIYIETFQKTLSSVNNISILNAIYLLKTSLIGSQNLIKKFGYFKPLQKAIGITKNGFCNIWINEHLYKNIIQQKYQTQDQMIKQIFTLIEKKTANVSQYNSLFKKAQHQKMNFYKAHNLISYFAYQQALVLPIKFLKSNQESFSFSKNITNYKWTNKNSQRLIKSSLYEKQHTYDIKKPIAKSSKQIKNQKIQVKSRNKLGFLNKKQNYRFQNNDYTQLTHSIEDKNLLTVQKLHFESKKSFQQTNKSTQGSAQLHFDIDLPEQLPQIEIHLTLRVPKLKKHRTLKLQTKKLSQSNNFDQDDQDFQIQSCYVGKKAQMKNSADVIKSSASNCWSQNDHTQKTYTEKGFKMNNWKIKINNLFDSQEINIKDSFHIIDKIDLNRQDRIQELKKLKINKLSSNQQVYQSILQNDSLQSILVQ